MKLMNNLVLLSMLSLVSALHANQYDKFKIEEFHPQLFWNRPREGFYDVDVGFNDPAGEGMKIMAIGDINNDKNADVITVGEGQDSFQLHLYNQTTRRYDAQMPPKPVQAKISSIVIARDMTELQSLYIIFDEDKEHKKGLMKVF